MYVVDRAFRNRARHAAQRRPDIPRVSAPFPWSAVASVITWLAVGPVVVLS